MPVTTLAIDQFRARVLHYYADYKRTMPWRTSPTPYFVLVSEIMLQQTQVPRVLPKFTSFIEKFPSVEALAIAPLADVLAQWNGLGYNRRAKYLWEAAKKIVNDFDGVVPNTRELLITLPGIGPNTAGAILAYAYNQPAIFVETNIRTVVIHEFFAKTDHRIADAEIATILQKALPNKNIREWYWALMDYGTYLKATVGGQLHRVKLHKRQSKFQGSRRQIRGQVLKYLIEGTHSNDELTTRIIDGRLADILATLSQEGLITYKNGYWHLTGQPG